MAGGGAGAGGTPLVGSAPDAQASALGLPSGQSQPPKRLSPSWDPTNHGGVQRELSKMKARSGLHRVSRQHAVAVQEVGGGHRLLARELDDQ